MVQADARAREKQPENASLLSDYMNKKKIIQPGKTVVVGQSGGGWGSIALASLNPSSVQAIVIFAAGRGGRVDGKPNNNCAPDKLVHRFVETPHMGRIHFC